MHVTHIRNEDAPSTRARLSLVLLLYFLGVIAVITLAPFRFVTPHVIHVRYRGEWFDGIANVLLFVPLGFLFPLTRSREAEPSPLVMLGLGALLSAMIEATQILEPGRVTSLVDVATNAAGCSLGAALARLAVRRIRVNARLVGRLSLEIPLVGLIYLLVPLVVATSLSAERQPLEMVSVLTLGLLGARLIGAAVANEFGPAGLLSPFGAAGVTTAWMILGAFPVLLRFPLRAATVVIAVATFAWYESGSAPPRAGADRRFESIALRRARPFVIAYFVFAIVLPLGAGIASWRVALGLTGAHNDVGAQMLRMLQPVAALTTLGYLIAEARGRRELPFRRVAWRVGLECCAVAALMEVSRAFQHGVGASVAQLGVVTVAGLLGAAIYHHQRAHVRWILAHRTDESTPHLRAR